MSFAPKIPDYPAAIAGGGVSTAIVSYAGPPRWEIPELLAKQRRGWLKYMHLARAHRLGGCPGCAARYLRDAAWCRYQIRSLLGSQRALDTVWAQRTAMPYPEYEARRITLIKAGVIRP